MSFCSHTRVVYNTRRHLTIATKENQDRPEVPSGLVLMRSTPKVSQDSPHAFGCFASQITLLTPSVEKQTDPGILMKPDM